jgi:hypothetical protein
VTPTFLGSPGRVTRSGDQWLITERSATQPQPACVRYSRSRQNGPGHGWRVPQTRNVRGSSNATDADTVAAGASRAICGTRKDRTDEEGHYCPPQMAPSEKTRDTIVCSAQKHFRSGPSVDRNVDRDTFKIPTGRVSHLRYRLSCGTWPLDLLSRCDLLLDLFKPRSGSGLGCRLNDLLFSSDDVEMGKDAVFCYATGRGLGAF